MDVSVTYKSHTHPHYIHITYPLRCTHKHKHKHKHKHTLFLSHTRTHRNIWHKAHHEVQEQHMTKQSPQVHVVGPMPFIRRKLDRRAVAEGEREREVNTSKQTTNSFPKQKHTHRRTGHRCSTTGAKAGNSDCRSRTPGPSSTRTFCSAHTARTSSSSNSSRGSRLGYMGRHSRACSRDSRRICKFVK